MGANSSYKAMYDLVEQAKGGTIFIPDDFVTYGTPDAVRSGLTRLCRTGKLYRFANGKTHIKLSVVNEAGHYKISQLYFGNRN